MANERAVSDALAAFMAAQRVSKETRENNADDEEAIKAAEAVASQAFRRWLALLWPENNSSGGRDTA